MSTYRDDVCHRGIVLRLKYNTVNFVMSNLTGNGEQLSKFFIQGVYFQGDLNLVQDFGTLEIPTFDIITRVHCVE